MGNLFKIGIAATCIAGYIFSKCFPVNTYLGEEAERRVLIQLFFAGATLIYLTWVFWNVMTQRLWLKIPLLILLLFISLVAGYVLTGFIIQPVLVSNAWTFRLLANNESNIVWYWSLGMVLIAWLLHAGVKLFGKIVRGETPIF